MTEPLFRARGLSRWYGSGRRRTVALHPTDLDIEAGQSLGIIGESGSGKSTLVRLLLGLDVASSGTATSHGRAISGRAPARSLHWLRRDTGVVFQDPYASLDPRMSVRRIVAEPLEALALDGDHHARVASALTDVGLDAGMAERYPHEFSGGQRQRIALARALVHNPAVLIGDEPMSALDVTVRAQILDLLVRRRDQHGGTLLLVSHDIGLVQNLCSHVAVMADGRLVEHGTAEQVLEHPKADATRRLLAAVPVITPPKD